MGEKKRGDRSRSREVWEPPQSRREDLKFHYDRDERLSLAAAPRSPEVRGFFRRYRTLLIILADIAILMILGLVALRFFGPPGSSVRLGPHGVSLRGLRYGDVVFATVTVRLATSAGEGPGQERVYARFALGPNAKESESYFDSAVAPRLEGQEVILQAALPFDEGAVRVYAEVQVGERIARLSLPRSDW